MACRTLRDLFIEQLNELHSGERRILEVLPQLEKAASSPSLSEALRRHHQQTRQHLDRLDRIFSQLGTRPRQVETAGMRGLLDDCLQLARDRDTEPHVRDAALIAAAQHVEHDEIAGYGCARTWAQLLGESQAADLLAQTLAEEKESDRQLTQIADRLNREALQPAVA